MNLVSIVEMVTVVGERGKMLSRTRAPGETASSEAAEQDVLDLTTVLALCR